MFGLIDWVQSVKERLEERAEYRAAWEEVDSELYYDTVVKQASGYVVHISRRTYYENQIDGAEKTKVEDEVDSVWRLYDRTNWSPGHSLEYRGEKVKCAPTANVFGGVARGYQQ
jgi:hypothetical protein